MNTLSFSLLAALLLAFAGCGERAAGDKADAVGTVKTEKQISAEEKLAGWKRQAEAGNAKEQYLLGIMYAIGDGVPKDAAKAAEWQKKAAEQGNADAQYILGYMYGEGQGVPKDFVQAHMWANIAAASEANIEEQKKFINLRESLTENMTAQQLAEARDLAKKCTANKFKGC